jgi:hypothetical protein
MLGATADEWLHFILELGLGENLLPCVPYAPDVRVLPGSALEGKVGKIPSMFNALGEAHGLTNWQKRGITSGELASWGGDRRLNLCLRLGPISGVYALDIDVDDREQADEIVALIERQLGTVLPMRYRDNSGKCLLLFRLEET